MTTTGSILTMAGVCFGLKAARTLIALWWGLADKPQQLGETLLNNGKNEFLHSSPEKKNNSTLRSNLFSPDHGANTNNDKATQTDRLMMINH